MVKAILFRLLLCLAVSSAFAEESTMSQISWDFGPADRVHPNMRDQHSTGPLTLNTAQTIKLSELPIRTLATSDGVTGTCLSLTLQARLADTRLFLEFDAGKEDIIATGLTVNNQSVEPHWSAFFEPPETRTSSKGIQYFTSLFLSRLQEHALTICNQHQPVILTSAHLFAGHDVSAFITALNQITPDYSFRPGYFSQVFAAFAPELKTNSFAAYAIESITRAERFVDMMGWEWATESTGLGIFSRYQQAVLTWDLWLAVIPRDSVWYDRVLFERARVLHWLWREQRGEAERIQSENDLSMLASKYPDIARIQMYAGKRIPNANNSALTIDENAPDWSRAQMQVIDELRRLAHWWVKERQADNGELGGKLGDDVELIRWWPVLTALDDKTVIAGWNKLAQSIWQSKKVAEGYSSRVLDVEHASEYIADTAPGMVYFSELDWYQQLAYNKTHFKFWTAPDKQGNLFFRSSWFSNNEMDLRPPRNRDVAMNARAMKPLRFLAVTQNDKEATTQVLSWAASWHKLAMNGDKGKPVGVFPVSYRVSDSKVNGDQPNWYHADMMWKYFEWEYSPGIKLYGHGLAAYLLTGESEFLQPMAKSLSLIGEHGQKTSNVLEGSPEWAANILKNKRSFWRYAGEWRMLSGDTQFDNLIRTYGDAYTQFQITGNPDSLLNDLQALANNLDHNRPMQTEEVLFTDRLYLGAGKRGGYASVLAMLTGDNSSGNNPFVHATWQNAPQGFSALVRSISQNELHSHVFIHQQSATLQTQPLSIRLWRLPLGRVVITVQSGTQVSTFSVDFKAPGQSIPLDLKDGVGYAISFVAVDE